MSGAGGAGGELLERWAFRLLLLIPFLYFGVGLSGRELVPPDEPRYALVAREMAEGGSLLLPAVNGQVYAHKPPLYFWAMVLESWISRRPVDELLARLPSALAGLSGILLTIQIGMYLYGSRAGMLAGLILGTGWLYVWESHTCRLDVLLTAWVLLAFLGLSGYARTGRSGSLWLFHLGCALGTLTKGPVGFLIPWGAALLWSGMRSRSIDPFAQVREGMGSPVPPAPGSLLRTPALLAFLVPVLGWLVPALIQGGPTYGSELIGRHVIQRYTDPWQHVHPWYYYLPRIPMVFLPWTVFLPGAVTYWRRRWISESQTSTGLLLAWVLFMLIFFSVTPGKRTVYLVPMLPALALLVAGYLSRIAGDSSRIEDRLDYGCGLVLWVTATYVMGILPRLASEELPDVTLPLTPLRVTLGVTAMAGILAVLRGGLPGRVLTLAGGAALVEVAAFVAMSGEIPPDLSHRRFAQGVLESAGDGEEVVLLGDLHEVVPFYLGRSVPVVPDPSRLPERIPPGGSLLLIARAGHLGTVRGLPEIAVTGLLEYGPEGKRTSLVRVRRLPPPPPAPWPGR